MEVLDDQQNETPPPLPLEESVLNSANASIRSLVIWMRHYIPDRAINALLKFLGVFF